MYCQNLLELALHLARPRPDLRGPRDQVLRALRVDRRGDERARASGTRRTASTTTCCTPTARSCRCGRARSSGCCRSRQSPRSAPRRWRGCPTSCARVEWFAPTGPRRARSFEHMESRRARGLADALDRGRGAPAPDPRRDARPGRVPLRPRPARALEVPRGEPAARLARRRRRRRSTTSRASRRAASSAATRTGAGRSGSRSTTSLVETLRVYHRYLGDGFTVEFPTGSGRELDLAQVADELAARLTSIFLDDDDGRRPVFGGYELFQRDPAWHDLIPFHEYFHGDTGAGPRRVAPDRMDRARRRPDHPPRPRGLSERRPLREGYRGAATIVARNASTSRSC